PNRAADSGARGGAQPTAPHPGGTIFHAPCSRTLVADRSDVELALEQLVDRLRIGLPSGCSHHLADEPADHRRLGFRLGDLVGIGRDDLVDDLLDRAYVRDLLEPALLDDIPRIAALAPDDLEQVLGDFS